jgi:hypothetical protein
MTFSYTRVHFLFSEKADLAEQIGTTVALAANVACEDIRVEINERADIKVTPRTPEAVLAVGKFLIKAAREPVGIHDDQRLYGRHLHFLLNSGAAKENVAMRLGLAEAPEFVIPDGCKAQALYATTPGYYVPGLNSLPNLRRP